jgi:hypothetical protein
MPKDAALGLNFALVHRDVKITEYPSFPTLPLRIQEAGTLILLTLFNLEVSYGIVSIRSFTWSHGRKGVIS